MAKDRTSEAADKALAEEELFSPCGLVIEKLPEEPGRSKMPDFRILSWRGLGGFCELKSPRDDWLQEMAEKSPGKIVGGVRPDPIFNRLARHVKDAVAQLDVVNPDREHPNVLLFVNHDKKAHIGDLYETLTGKLLTETGETFPTMPHVAKRLSGIANRVDLYAWVDVSSRRVQLMFTCANEKHFESLKLIFQNKLGKERWA